MPSDPSLEPFQSQRDGSNEASQCILLRRNFENYPP